jgi:hypothetical protein
MPTDFVHWQGWVYFLRKFTDAPSLGHQLQTYIQCDNLDNFFIYLLYKHSYVLFIVPFQEKL